MEPLFESQCHAQRRNTRTENNCHLAKIFVSTSTCALHSELQYFLLLIISILGAGAAGGDEEKVSNAPESGDMRPMPSTA